MRHCFRGGILPLPKKGDLGIAKNYGSITFTSIATKIYYDLLLNYIEPEIEKILRKNQNGFHRNRFTSQILIICQILGVCAKNLEAILLFIDFSETFDSIHRGKMEQILLAYGLLRETVAAIIMLNKNTKVKVCSRDRNTAFFDIIVVVLLGDTLAPYLFIICLDYVLWTLIDLMKENGISLEKARSRWYPAQTMTDTDNTDVIVLLANTPAQAKSLLHSLEWTAGGIVLHVNADKTEYMCFNLKGDNSTLNGGSLK